MSDKCKTCGGELVPVEEIDWNDKKWSNGIFASDKICPVCDGFEEEEVEIEESNPVRTID